MDKKTSESRVYPWVTFIAIVLLLLGIFGAVRTAINMMAFEKYPSTGVYAFSFMMPGFYGPREQDCTYPQPYFTPDGKSRTPSKEEKEQEKIMKQNCLDGVREAREQAKINDMSQSALFLTLGLGLLVTRKRFFR